MNHCYKYSAYVLTITFSVFSLRANQTPIECLFTDILGIPHSVTIARSELQSALTHGLKFDGSSIPGYSSIDKSDLHLKLDPATLKQGYYGNNSIIVCDVAQSENTPYARDARTILKEQIAHAQSLGINFLVGTELEFFVFHKRGESDLTTLKSIDADHYFSRDRSSQQKCFKDALFAIFDDQKLPIEKFHHEVASSQYEISLHYNDALSCADALILAKETVKEAADSLGFEITFMPKPFEMMNGSGMHIHFSCADKETGHNLFYSEEDPEQLSPYARSFIAGVLRRIKEISAFCNPTINSYKRLIPGYESPVYICWDMLNRSALIRIPQINHHQSQACRAELRSPDAMCNPYIVYALLLAAGLEGVTDSLTLPERIGYSAYSVNTDSIDKLPTSLAQALIELDHSAFVRGVLGDQLVDEFITLKRKELASFSRAITDWELLRYF